MEFRAGNLSLLRERAKNDEAKINFDAINFK